MKNIRKFLALFLALMMIFTLAACSNNEPNPTDGTDEAFPPVTITYDTPFGSTHPFSVVDQQFAAALEERANIKTTFFYTSALISPVTPYQEILAGVADSVQVIPGAEADHFYVTNAVQCLMAWGNTNTAAAYEAACTMQEKCDALAAEYEGVVPYSVKNAGEYLYFITNEPVRTLSDLKGMSIRIASDSDAALVEAFGGIPVRLDVPQMMENMEKGVIDGLLLTVECMESMGFAEVCKYVTATNLVSTFCVQKYLSRETYDSFTAEQQAAFDEIAKEYDQVFIETGKELEASAIEYSLSQGVEFIELTEEEYARINQVYEDYAQVVIQQLNDHGYDGQAIYDLARQCVAEAEAEHGEK